jgi:hypothetical protein
MKRICVFFKITALAMVTILFLNGCSRQTIDSSGNDASAPATSTISGGVISREQAVEIAKDVYERSGSVFFVLIAPTFLDSDSTQTVPGHSQFWLVTDERFPTIAALKAFVETAYTPSYIEKHLSGYYDGIIKYENASIISPADTSFVEYDGRLYANDLIMGYGNNIVNDWDTLKIISQDNDTLTVEVDVVYWRDKEPRGVRTYVMKKSGNTWRLDDEIYQSLE